MMFGPLFVKSDGLTPEDLKRFATANDENPKDKEIRELTMNLNAPVESVTASEDVRLKIEEQKLRSIEDRVVKQLEDAKQDAVIERLKTSSAAMDDVVEADTLNKESGSSATRKIVMYDGQTEREAELNISAAAENNTVLAAPSSSLPEKKPPVEMRGSLNPETFTPKSPSTEVEMVSTKDIDALRVEFQRIRSSLGVQEEILRSIDDTLVSLSDNEPHILASAETYSELDLAPTNAPEVAKESQLPLVDSTALAQPKDSLSSSAVRAARASLYTGPAKFDSPIMNLYEGTKIKIIETRGDWTYVKAPNGIKGWVRSKYLG